MTIQDRLVSVLGMDRESVDQIISYAFSMPDWPSVREFLEDILQGNAHRDSLMRECEVAWRETQKPAPKTHKTSTPQTASPATVSRASTPVLRGSPARTPRSQSPAKAPVQISMAPQFKFSQGVWDPNGGTSKKAKPKKPQQTSTSSTKVKVDSLADIDRALRQLDTVTPSKTRTPCDCMATRHPLLEIAPNCLNCGKIICTKEGLGPCTSCGTDLISNQDLQQITTILRAEKDELSTGLGRRARKQANVDTGKTLSQVGSGSAGLEKAQERLDTLLNYQETSAQRTKIIDQVSDFDTPYQGVNKWASPMEQAQQLKRQQRQLRKAEELQLARSGRGRKVVSIDLKGNKVYAVEHDAVDVESSSSSEDEAVTAVPEPSTKKAAAAWNPKSYGKEFVKPVYKPGISPASAPVERNSSRSKKGSSNKEADPGITKLGLSLLDSSGKSRVAQQEDESRVLEM